MDVIEERRRAAQHFDAGDWAAAFDTWSRLAPGDLEPPELDRLATAAELLGRHDETIRALQQEFTRLQADGDVAGAVHCAFRLAMTSSAHGEPALSMGWLARAEELVASLDEDSVEHGWVAFLRMFRHLGAGELDRAASAADVAVATGRRLRDPDLTAIGVCSQGRLALYAGRVAEGLALLDEAMVRVIAGELSPVIAGHVYCTAIEGCQEISDLARVSQWTSALERWCAAQPDLLAFTGQCALHRGQLLRLRGDWPGALSELSLAIGRYEQVGSPDAVGAAAYETGDLLRLRGEHDAADAAYRRAADHGFDPQPGLTFLWLARGRTDAARASIARQLAETHGPVQRCRILPAAVEVLLAAGEVETARTAADELATLCANFDTTPLEATARAAMGAVELAADDPAGALPYLRRAQLLWARFPDPYEAARVRVLTGRALTALGDTESARRELEAALDALRLLGADPAADDVARLLRPDSRPAGLTAREVEVLRLVAGGRSNPEIARELVLSEKTVARHLSNIFGKLGVGSRTAAAAFAFEHRLVDSSTSWGRPDNT